MNLIDIKDGKFMGVWDEEQGRGICYLLGFFYTSRWKDAPRRLVHNKVSKGTIREDNMDGYRDWMELLSHPKSTME
jgi:hypothetical protein